MSGEIRTYFELEARELVDQLTRGVALLGGSASSAEQTRGLARAAHTLKGAAHVVEERGIASLAHDFEDALADYGKAPGAPAVARLLHLTDALSTALTAALTPASGSGVAPAAESVEEQNLPTPGWIPVLESTVRVDRDLAAKLLNQLSVAGSVVSAMRAKLAQTAGRPQSVAATGSAAARRTYGSSGQTPASSNQRSATTPLGEELAGDLDRLERQMAALHATASGLNLASTATLLVEAGRIVRSAAAATDREVACVTEGVGDRVDVQIVEGLRDALLHLIRNAVVHGVESPSERRALGKRSTATITVGVHRRGSAVELVCADDGRGIALEPIRSAAIQQGVLSVEQAATAGRATLLALLLRPGFSTRRRTDAMAGRGVGLDAVHQAAQRLGGEVRIESEPGRGTRFSIIAPRTLFSLNVIEVTAAGIRYAIPVDAVEQTLRLDEHHKGIGQSSRSVLVNGGTMPYLMLQDAMPASQLAPVREVEARRAGPSTCLILRAGTERFALAVDRIEGTGEVLMHPLPAMTGADERVAGAALNAAGQPFLVLHPAALLASAAAHPAGAQPVVASSERTAAPILVIDDSLTTRMLEQSILETEGYTVDLAVSGEQGLAMARQKRYALFLVDVEMPGMNGFEFIQAAGAVPELAGIPSILVTSLDSAEDRDRGRAAGAASYVVKGEFNQQVYLNRIRAVMRGAG